MTKSKNELFLDMAQQPCYLTGLFSLLMLGYSKYLKHSDNMWFQRIFRSRDCYECADQITSRLRKLGQSSSPTTFAGEGVAANVSDTISSIFEDCCMGRREFNKYIKSAFMQRYNYFKRTCWEDQLDINGVLCCESEKWRYITFYMDDDQSTLLYYVIQCPGQAMEALAKFFSCDEQITKAFYNDFVDYSELTYEAKIRLVNLRHRGAAQDYDSVLQQETTILQQEVLAQLRDPLVFEAFYDALSHSDQMFFRSADESQAPGKSSSPQCKSFNDAQINRLLMAMMAEKMCSGVDKVWMALEQARDSVSSISGLVVGGSDYAGKVAVVKHIN